MAAGLNSQREVLQGAWSAALAAAHPGSALAGQLPAAPEGRLVIIAAGKAAAAMAQAALDHYLPDLDRLSGVVVAPGEVTWEPGPLKGYSGGHPLPNMASEHAGRAVLRSARGAGAGDTVLCLLSGGASALMTVPDGVSLQELRALHKALLASGADIAQVNTVRRKLCRLKGGGLAEAAAPAGVTALLLSDVVDDDPAIIASGPTVADPDGPGDALAVLESLGIDIPAVTERLRRLQHSWSPGPVHTYTRVVASGAASLKAAADFLAKAGYRTRILSASVTGDSAEAAASHAGTVRRLLGQAGESITEPLALLSGGETTVRTTGAAGGTGGRNSHFALALACEMWGETSMTALCADTDGTDGNSKAAGAFVTPDLYRTGSLGAARKALEGRDSGGYLAAQGHAHVSGPTGTNVNDLRMILLEST